MTARISGPARTCIVCRQVRAKDDLVRLVVVGERIERDPDGTRPGRGAYVCATPACRSRAKDRAATALRAPGSEWAVEETA